MGTQSRSDCFGKAKASLSHFLGPDRRSRRTRGGCYYGSFKGGGKDKSYTRRERKRLHWLGSLSLFTQSIPHSLVPDTFMYIGYFSSGRYG